MPRRFIRALGIVKRSAACANAELGELDDEVFGAIRRAAEEVMEGRWDDQFVVDVFQTGSGTSTNMNANEVIANRAIQILGGEVGSKQVHPNDHVNRSQSSNDVIPTTLHVAGATAIEEDLIPALKQLAGALGAKADELADLVKSGRTHLMDATPITLGQEMSGYATQARKAVERAGRARDALLELPLGGTAVGTGLNCPPEFPRIARHYIIQATGITFVEAENHFEAQAARDGLVEAHGQLDAIAASFTKIANDLRLLGSGPRAGLAEITLPTLQPGSSIMPGKVNPVLCETLTQVAARVLGNQTTIAVCGMSGQFELNTFMPLMGFTFLESVSLLAAGARTFAARCVAGIEANRDRLKALVERNLSLGTALAPEIGYDAAAKLAKEAFRTGRTVREVALEQGVLPEDQLDTLLDPRRMTHPHGSAE